MKFQLNCLFTRVKIPVFLVGFWFLLAVISPFTFAATCEKTVRWNNDPPYSFRNAQGIVTGFYVELIQHALKKMGCTTNLVEMPWARALVELEAGRLDILPGALKTEDRKRFALFSSPINSSPNILFMKKSAIEKFNLKTLDDILKTNFRLGAQIHVSYGASFDELSKNPTFVKHLSQIRSRENGWKMIEVDHIDGLIADEATGLMELNELNLDSLIVKSKVVTSTDAGTVAFSKKSVSSLFLDNFNTVIKEMITNGEYVRIREKYIPCNVSLRTLACK
jgi:polar amino acid transport system substrate-binding protein